MNITKDIINDLIPLYAANECSADTRRLVEEYLQQNPQQADELRRIMSTPIPGTLPPAKSLEETRAFREARRRIRRRAFFMGLAIFFSLAPLSISNINGQVWWCLRDSPGTALIYAAIAVVFWILYAVNRKRSSSL
jgi:hypothetical protein